MAACCLTARTRVHPAEESAEPAEAEASAALSHHHSEPGANSVAAAAAAALMAMSEGQSIAQCESLWGTEHAQRAQQARTQAVSVSLDATVGAGGEAHNSGEAERASTHCRERTLARAQHSVSDHDAGSGTRWLQSLLRTTKKH